MTEQEYRTHPAISRSSLWKINKSPMHFKYAVENPPETTPALRFGAAAHKYILEPDDFHKEFAVCPPVDRRTKIGKEMYANFMLASEGKIVIDQAEYEQIKDMAAAIEANPIAKAFLNGTHEEPFFWVDDVTAEECKCRTDCRTEIDGVKYIVDYKTTDSCEDGHFERSCRKYGYKFQAGMYSEGVFQATLVPHRFAFVAQEKNPPYAARVYICSEEFVAEGYDQFRQLLGIYHDCKQTGKWPGYEGNFGATVTLSGEDEYD